MRCLAVLLLLAPFARSGAAAEVSTWALPSVGAVWTELRSPQTIAAVPAIQASDFSQASPGPALPKDVLPVPIHRQETDYSCGAASLLSVLRYWQAFDGKESDLYGPLQTSPKDGTEPPKLRDVAEKLGLKAELRTEMTLDDLRLLLAKGTPVILDIQAWREGSTAHIPWEKNWEDGHYVVLIGMDEKYAYFMDPVLNDSYAYMPLDELPKRWHDYEDRHGTVERYYQAGIALSGKTPVSNPTLPHKRPARLD